MEILEETVAADSEIKLTKAKNWTTKYKKCGRQITLTEARKWTNDYEEQCAADDIRSLTISAEHLRKILEQPDCQSIRFFIALTQPEKATSVGLPAGHSIVIVGADKKQNNIIKGDYDTLIFDDCCACPPNCTGGGGMF